MGGLFKQPLPLPMGQLGQDHARKLFVIVTGRPRAVRDYLSTVGQQQFLDRQTHDAVMAVFQHDFVARRGNRHLDPLDGLTVITEPGADSHPHTSAAHADLTISWRSLSGVLKSVFSSPRQSRCRTAARAVAGSQSARPRTASPNVWPSTSAPRT